MWHCVGVWGQANQPSPGFVGVGEALPRPLTPQYCRASAVCQGRQWWQNGVCVGGGWKEEGRQGRSVSPPFPLEWVRETHPLRAGPRGGRGAEEPQQL